MTALIELRNFPTQEIEYGDRELGNYSSLAIKRLQLHDFKLSLTNHAQSSQGSNY
jgi:hypothetical protein